MASLGCQPALSAGLVAAAGAAGACTTYGMQPGAVVALAGEVLPCLWECARGGQAAVRGSRQLLEALDKRLKVWPSVVFEGFVSFPDLPVRLGGVTHAGSCLIRHLTRHARAVADAGPSQAPSAQQQQQGQQQEQEGPGQQQQQQQELEHQQHQALAGGEGRAREGAAVAAGEPAAGASVPQPGTWLRHVPRAVAIDYAARALVDLSDLARAEVALADEEADEDTRHMPEQWRPLWWWRWVVPLLPLLAIGRPREVVGEEVGEGEGQWPWRPIAFDHPYLTITCRDDNFTLSCRCCNACMLQDVSASACNGVRTSHRAAEAFAVTPDDMLRDAVAFTACPPALL